MDATLSRAIGAPHTAGAGAWAIIAVFPNAPRRSHTMSFSSQHIASILMRCTLGAIFASHAIFRLVKGSVPALGATIDAHGIPYGIVFAWCITLFELFASAALICNRWVSVVAVMLSVEMAVAIAFVHARHGWFVVGFGNNGMEFAVLLIAALMATALTSHGK